MQRRKGILRSRPDLELQTRRGKIFAACPAPSTRSNPGDPPTIQGPAGKVVGCVAGPSLRRGTTFRPATSERRRAERYKRATQRTRPQRKGGAGNIPPRAGSRGVRLRLALLREHRRKATARSGSGTMGPRRRRDHRAVVLQRKARHAPAIGLDSRDGRGREARLGPPRIIAAARRNGSPAPPRTDSSWQERWRIASLHPEPRRECARTVCPRSSRAAPSTSPRPRRHS